MSVILKMDHETIFYVPSTQGLSGGATIRAIEHRISEIAKQFSTWYGGVTVTKVTGGYVSNDGQYITETVHTVASSTDSEGIAKYRAQVEALAETKRVEWGQETIGIKFDNEFELVG